MTSNTHPSATHAAQNGHLGGSIRVKGAHTARHGERLLPMVADELAARDPGKIYCSFPRTSDVKDGFRDVTIAELVNAANTAAWWLEGKFGRSDDFETIAYMGVVDIRYTIMFIAAVKCGYKMLVPSMRNSVSMNVSLMQTTGCKRVIHSENVDAKIQELKEEATGVERVPFLGLEELLRSPKAKHYPYEQNFREVENDPALVCHTSGSTGNPKPITMTHGSMAVWDGHRNIPKIPGRRNQDYALFDFGEGGGRFYSSYPPFHLAGFVTMCFLPIMYPATIMMSPPDRPGTGEMVVEIMRQHPLRAIFCAPSILEQIVQEQGGLELAKSLDFAIFTGGPLAPRAGDALSEVTDLCQLYGQSETGVIAALVPRREDWPYFEFQPAYKQQMELVGDEEYEMVIPRDMTLKWMRGICHTFPDVEEWRTRDVFKPHPTKKGLWRFQGRTDDIMVLGNGEKFNPVPMEAIVQGHPQVGGALMVGQGRFQPALLVEEQAGSKFKGEELIDEIWPFIEEANKAGPGHAKIVRSKVVAVPNGQQFKRAGKGTVIRKQTIAACADQIEEMYSDKNLRARKTIPSLPLPFEREQVLPFVRTLVRELNSGMDIKDSDDFFNLGLDSLQTIEMVSALRIGLEQHLDPLEQGWLAVRMIYSRPSITALANEIASHLSKDGSMSGTNNTSQEPRIAEMKRIVQQYTHDLPDLLPVPRKHQKKLHIVLTGSTGSLGTHILESLMKDRRVSTITCLNRSATARQRHIEAFAKRGVGHKYNLSTDPIFFDARGILGSRDTGSNISFLTADFGDPRFGLLESTFNALRDETDAIIHNAWKVDFNHSLASFEAAHICGVRNFIDWSIKGAKHPHLTFVSSISSVGGWPSGSLVPETPHADYAAASPLGYGESKHVSERILTIASQRCGVPVSILRVGQIAGPLSRDGGCWNEAEWLPSLVKTSLAMGLLPATLAPVDWIPVDTLAGIISQIVHARAGASDLRVFNLVNPTVTSWETLLPPVLKRAGKEARVVPLQDWVRALEASETSSPEVIAQRPAVKIVDFFRAFAQGGKGETRYVTENGRAASGVMKGLSGVRAQWMEVWLDQWGF